MNQTDFPNLLKTRLILYIQSTPKTILGNFWKVLFEKETQKETQN